MHLKGIEFPMPSQVKKEDTRLYINRVGGGIGGGGGRGGKGGGGGGRGGTFELKHIFYGKVSLKEKVLRLVWHNDAKVLQKTIGIS